MPKSQERTTKPKPLLDKPPKANALFNDTARSVGFDIKRYEHFLDDANLTETQKHELLASLWRIVTQFVQMGFGVHPVQQAKAQQRCGQASFEESDLSAVMLSSIDAQERGQA